MSVARKLPFSVITGGTVGALLAEDYQGCVDEVGKAYLAHAAGRSITPPSVFLKFPDRPNARIIGLTSHLQAPWQVSGMKWIASYPENVAKGFPRASAVLVLNDHDTGYPFVCMEGSVISAARTAASAALAASLLHPTPRSADTLGIVGSGLIASYVYRFLMGTGWNIGRVKVHDTNPEAAEQCAGMLRRQERHRSVETQSSAESVIQGSDLVLFATVARAPYVKDPEVVAHRPTILHLSLRDLAPELVLGARNVVDDADHAVTAETSLHLAEQIVKHRRFVHCTLADVMRGQAQPERSQAVIFSPFGLGALDVAVGQWIYDKAIRAKKQVVVDNFFPMTNPWS